MNPIDNQLSITERVVNNLIRKAFVDLLTAVQSVKTQLNVYDLSATMDLTFIDTNGKLFSLQNGALNFLS